MTWKTLCHISTLVLVLVFSYTVTLHFKLEAFASQPHEEKVAAKKEVKEEFIKTEDILAIQNKNPMNIKALANGDKWKGQIGVDKFGHVIFESWEFGLRASAMVLKNYAIKHKINTVEGVVKRFCVGNQKQYADFLAKRLGVKPQEKFCIIKRMPELLQAMAKFESGHEFPAKYMVAYDLLAAI